MDKIFGCGCPIYSSHLINEFENNTTPNNFSTNMSVICWDPPLIWVRKKPEEFLVIPPVFYQCGIFCECPFPNRD